MKRITLSLCIVAAAAYMASCAKPAAEPFATIARLSTTVPTSVIELTPTKSLAELRADRAATAAEMATDTPEPTATPETATRANPLPWGERRTIHYENGAIVTVGVRDVLRGARSMALLKRTNMFNDAPGDGNQWVLAKFYLRVEGDAEDDTFNQWDQNVWAIVANGRIADGSSLLGLVMPRPEFEGEIIPPGEIEGWAAFEVPDTKDISAVFLRQGKAQEGGYWFSLDKP